MKATIKEVFNIMSHKVFNMLKGSEGDDSMMLYCILLMVCGCRQACNIRKILIHQLLINSMIHYLHYLVGVAKSKLSSTQQKLPSSLYKMTVGH